MRTEQEREQTMPKAPPWPKGVSGNPGGRAKDSGLAARVRALTGDGQVIAEFYLAVFNGKLPGTNKRPTPAMRMLAAEWLADRGHGRSIQTTDLNLSGFEGVDIRLLGPARAAEEKGEEGE